jgi:hypothetical protein
MKAHRLFALIVAALFSVSSAWAIDEGQTRPRLSSASIVSPNTTVDLVPLTSGSGNLKGIHCIFDSASSNRVQQVDIFVDGGAAQSLLLYAGDFPQESDGTGRTGTGFIPMNVRFGSSLKIQLKRFSSPAVSYGVACLASWALD